MTCGRHARYAFVSGAPRPGGGGEEGGGGEGGGGGKEGGGVKGGGREGPGCCRSVGPSWSFVLDFALPFFSPVYSLSLGCCHSLLVSCFWILLPPCLFCFLKFPLSPRFVAMLRLFPLFPSPSFVCSSSPLFPFLTPNQSFPFLFSHVLSPSDTLPIYHSLPYTLPLLSIFSLSPLSSLLRSSSLLPHLFLTFSSSISQTFPFLKFLIV